MHQSKCYLINRRNLSDWAQAKLEENHHKIISSSFPAKCFCQQPKYALLVKIKTQLHPQTIILFVMPKEGLGRIFLSMMMKDDFWTEMDDLDIDDQKETITNIID